MKNNYIINNDFYIKNDLSSFLIYYDHFSLGLSNLNRYTDSPLIKKSLHYLLRIFIILTFYLKIYKYLYKNISLEEDAIIIIKKKGQWANTLKLFKKNGELKMLKKSFNEDAYKREQIFFNTYKDNTTKIQLINHKFLDNNFIEMDFVKSKNLQRLINEGDLNFQECLEHFRNIKNELKFLYKNNPTLVHGDLWLPNIFINTDRYYLIDYTDAHEETTEYDLYVFLLSLLSSFKNFGTDRNAPDFYLKKRELISKLLDIRIDELLELEKRYKKFRTLKSGRRQ